MYRCLDCGTFTQPSSVPVAGRPVCSHCNEPLDVSGAPQHVTAERYAEALASSPVPVVVDFWASWAPPSRAADSVVEQFGRKHAGKVLVLRVNSDKSPKLLAQLGISSVPTFQAIQDGEERARHGGVLRQDAFDRWADRAFLRVAA